MPRSKSSSSLGSSRSLLTCSEIMAISIEDLKKPDFWRAVAAEFLGTMFLIVIGVGACFVWHPHHPPSPTHIALHTGLYIAFIITATGHISGGLVNPALSISFAIANRISVARAIFYVIAQCLGSITGTAILYVLVPEGIQGDLGTLKLNNMVTEAQGFGVEFIITFILLFGIFAATDKDRNDLGGSLPLTIGLIVTVNLFFGMNYTGGGMNPARQLGPCVFSGKWDHHWIYWLGPITGGVSGTLLYKYVFAAAASCKQAKRCIFRSGSYDSVSMEVKPVNIDEDDDDFNSNDKRALSSERISSI